MASLILQPGTQQLSNNGAIAAGAQLYVYQAGTTTPVTTYSDKDLVTAQAHPVVADASGRFPNIYVSGGAFYKLVMHDSVDVEIWTSDDVPPYIAGDGGVLPIANGGTESPDAPTALTSLGAAAASDLSTLTTTVGDIETGQVTGDWETGTATDKTAVGPDQVKAAILANQSSGVPDAIVIEQQATTVDGGTFTAGAWQTRLLNTISAPGALASLASNEITVTKDGYIRFEAVAFSVGQHQTRLYNVTDATVDGEGIVVDTDAGSNDATTISAGGCFVLAGKTYRLEHRCEATEPGDGFGNAASFGGNEVYAYVTYWAGDRG